MIFSCQKLYVFDEHKSLDINVNFIDYYYYLDIDRIITFRSRSERASAIKQIQQHSHRIAACHNHESFGNRGAAFDSMTKLHKRKKMPWKKACHVTFFTIQKREAHAWNVQRLELGLLLNIRHYKSLFSSRRNCVK